MNPRNPLLRKPKLPSTARRESDASTFPPHWPLHDYPEEGAAFARTPRLPFVRLAPSILFAQLGLALFLAGGVLAVVTLRSLDNDVTEALVGCASLSAFGLVAELIAVRRLSALIAWRNGRIVPARVDWIKQGIHLPPAAAMVISFVGGAAGAFVSLLLLTFGKSRVAVSCVESGRITHRNLRLDSNFTAAVPGQPLWLAVTDTGRATPLWNVPFREAVDLRVPVRTKAWMNAAFEKAATSPPPPALAELPSVTQPADKQTKRLQKYR
jgi:hypothetical protein